jgi:hypothetical protein
MGGARLAGRLSRYANSFVAAHPFGIGKAVQSLTEQRTNIMTNTAPAGASAPAIFNFQVHEVRAAVRCVRRDRRA